MSRHDTFLTTLGNRADRGCSRLWIEDSAGRLTRNGFHVGSGFEMTPRLGLGFLLRASVLASTHVSSRRTAAILSLESPRLRELLRGTPEARVRVSCSTIVVMPSLRLFSIRAAAPSQVWRIAGNDLVRPEGVQEIDSRLPARFDVTPARLDAALTEANLVFATEIMAHAKPLRIALSGNPTLVAVAGQFLAAIGYGLTAEGEFAR